MPIEPAMKLKSCTPTTAGLPSTVPTPTWNASLCGVAARACLRRSVYFFESRNLSGSSRTSGSGNSSKPSSSSWASRASAPMRPWCSHFGHTERLASNSREKIISWQRGHLTHRFSGVSRLLPNGSALRTRVSQLIAQSLEWSQCSHWPWTWPNGTEPAVASRTSCYRLGKTAARRTAQSAQKRAPRRSSRLPRRRVNRTGQRFGEGFEVLRSRLAMLTDQLDQRRADHHAVGDARDRGRLLG